MLTNAIFQKYLLIGPFEILKISTSLSLFQVVSICYTRRRTVGRNVKLTRIIIFPCEFSSISFDTEEIKISF